MYFHCHDETRGYIHRYLCCARAALFLCRCCDSFRGRSSWFLMVNTWSDVPRIIRSCRTRQWKNTANIFGEKMKQRLKTWLLLIFIDSIDLRRSWKNHEKSYLIFSLFLWAVEKSMIAGSGWSSTWVQSWMQGNHHFLTSRTGCWLFYVVFRTKNGFTCHPKAKPSRSCFSHVNKEFEEFCCLQFRWVVLRARWVNRHKDPASLRAFQNQIDGSRLCHTSWWFEPLWKYESQLGWLFQIYAKIKHVPNHQPAH